jgi:hypothetical protein
MKTPEDEAFDELAQRQGGGGFPAKRKMAADKLHWSDCAVHNAPAYPAGKCDCGVAQEPANYLHAVLSAFGPDAGISLDQKGWSQLHAAIKAVLMQPAQEPEMLTIAYQSGYYDGKKAAQRPWVGLTDQESIDVIKKDNNYKYPIQLLQAVMDALKEKNT